MHYTLHRKCRRCLKIGPWVNECVDCLDIQRAARVDVWGYNGEDEEGNTRLKDDREPLDSRRRRERQVVAPHEKPAILTMVGDGCDVRNGVIASVDRILSGKICLSGDQSPIHIARRARLHPGYIQGLQPSVSKDGCSGMEDD